MKDTVGSRIRTIRKERKMTQNELAEELGFTRQALSNWENDKTQPDLETITEIAEILDCSIEYLLVKDDRITKEIGDNDHVDSARNERSRLHFTSYSAIVLVVMIVAVCSYLFQRVYIGWNDSIVVSEVYYDNLQNSEVESAPGTLYETVTIIVAEDVAVTINSDIIMLNKNIHSYNGETLMISCYYRRIDKIVSAFSNNGNNVLSEKTITFPYPVSNILFIGNKPDSDTISNERELVVIGHKNGNKLIKINYLSL